MRVLGYDRSSCRLISLARQIHIIRMVPIMSAGRSEPCSGCQGCNSSPTYDDSDEELVYRSSNTCHTISTVASSSHHRRIRECCPELQITLFPSLLVPSMMIVHSRKLYVAVYNFKPGLNLFCAASWQHLTDHQFLQYSEYGTHLIECAAFLHKSSIACVLQEFIANFVKLTSYSCVGPFNM